MNKLYLYSIFHANLNFSCIPREFFPQVLNNCYWPLLNIVENQNVALGLEFSGHTLELIDSMDHSFLLKLRELWNDGRCEVIGSGYVQSIMPLIPTRVNRENLKIGNLIYEKFFGRHPDIAYLNEQVYSAGLPPLYEEAGYRAIIANWESSNAAKKTNDFLYGPAKVKSGDGQTMPVIWHSTLAYQNFQMYVGGELGIDSYLANLESHISDQNDRAYQLYGSDWEVFDFRPWRCQPNDIVQPRLGEMSRISDLLYILENDPKYQLVTPSSLLSLFDDFPLVNIESTEFPITYKKQDLNSVTRWAVGGRDGLRLNTQCYDLYQDLLYIEWILAEKDKVGECIATVKNEIESLWHDLCFLWNSDLRTFTTEDKHFEARNVLGAAVYRANRLKTAFQSNSVDSSNLVITNCSKFHAQHQAISFAIKQDESSPLTNDGLVLEVNGSESPGQITSQIGYGPYLSVLATPILPADGKQIGRIISKKGISNKSDLRYSIDSDRHCIETQAVRLILDPAKGGSISELTFSSISGEPLIHKPDTSVQSDHQGKYDYLSGDVVFEDWSGKLINDHRAIDIQYMSGHQPYNIFVPVYCTIPTEAGVIWKTYKIYLSQPRVDLSVRFQLWDLVPRFFRIGRMTINPRAFDHSSLYYATTNGGDVVEKFSLIGNLVNHDQAFGLETIAHGSMGSTEGWVILGDHKKGVGFITQQASLYSVPLLHYEESDLGVGSFLLSLVHTLGEGDETSHTLWRGHSNWNLSIMAGEQELFQDVIASAALSNGGIQTNQMYTKAQ